MPVIHELPEYATHSQDYHVWVGIQACRRTKNSFVYKDAPLFSNVTGRKLHIGFISSYMYRYKTATSVAHQPLFNLYLYKPLLDLYRLRMEELYIQYLHISYEPYHLFIDSVPYTVDRSHGTILYQITKRSYIKNNLP